MDSAHDSSLRSGAPSAQDAAHGAGAPDPSGPAPAAVGWSSGLTSLRGLALVLGVAAALVMMGALTLRLLATRLGAHGTGPAGPPGAAVPSGWGFVASFALLGLSLVGALWLVTRHQKPRTGIRAQLGYRRPADGWTRAAGGALARVPLTVGGMLGGVGLMLLVLGPGALTRGGPSPLAGLLQGSSVISLLVLAVVAAPLVEETLCRGLLLPVLVQRLGVQRGLWAQALVFGLLHGRPVLIPGATLVGYVLGRYAWGRRSSLASMLLHALHNATVVGLSLLGTYLAGQLGAGAH